MRMDNRTSEDRVAAARRTLLWLLLATGCGQHEGHPQDGSAASSNTSPAAATSAEASTSPTFTQEPPSASSEPTPSGPEPEPDPDPAEPPEPEPEPEPEPTMEPGTPQPEPPSVHDVRDIVAPWGHQLELKGTALRDRNARLFIGGLALAPDADAVVSWSDDAITFRVPFPHQGALRVETPAGSVSAGSFTSEWQLGPSLELADALTPIATLSDSPNELVIAVDTTPIEVLSLRAGTWERTPLPTDDVDAASFGFFQTSAGALMAFAVSASEPKTLRSFDAAAGWNETAGGVDLGEYSQLTAAGGRRGAVVWLHRSEGWEALSNADGSWSSRGAPVPQPGSMDQATPGASDDGTLSIVYAVDTGNFFDDHETPYVRRLRAGGTEFEQRQIAGSAMDDYLTSLRVQSRGAGIAVEYCGSDIDPLGLGSTAYRCRSAALTVSGASVLRAPPFARTRYAFTDHLVGIAHCSDTRVTWLTAHYDSDHDLMLGWPCLELEALEIDPRGQWLPIVRHDGRWHLLTSHHLATDPLPDQEADAGLDAGHEPDAGYADAASTVSVLD